MNHKPEPIQIPPGDPYQNDKLDRKKCGDSLKRLVINAKGPLVVTISGGWGTGKTTFLDMWKHDLKKDGFTTVHFNAWEDDYHGDALIAIIGQMWDSLKDTDYGEIVNSIKECAAPVVRSMIYNAAKTISAGIVDLNDAKLKSTSEKAVDDYLTAGQNLKDLKARLADLANKVLAKGKPLVIIVDELDRCRPTFAVELLERIKHLFDIPGVVFVLAIARDQLDCSIKSIYGEGMDVGGYLSKFVDLNFILPDGNTSIFVQHSMERFGINKFFAGRQQPQYIHRGEEYASFIKAFTDLATVFDLKLRDIEHCIRIMVVAASNLGNDKHFYPYLASVLIILRQVNLKLYSEYLRGNCYLEKITEYISQQPTGKRYLDSRGGIIIEAFLLASSPQEWRQKIVSQLQRLVKGEVHTDTDMPQRYVVMEKGRREELAKFYDHARGIDISENAIKHMTDMIEIASFVTD